MEYSVHTSSPEYHQGKSLAELCVGCPNAIITMPWQTDQKLPLGTTKSQKIPQKGSTIELSNRDSSILPNQVKKNYSPIHSLTPKVIVPKYLEKLCLTKKYYYKSKKTAKNLPNLNKGNIENIKLTTKKPEIVKRVAQELRSYTIQSLTKQYSCILPWQWKLSGRTYNFNNTERKQ